MKSASNKSQIKTKKQKCSLWFVQLFRISVKIYDIRELNLKFELIQFDYTNSDKIIFGIIDQRCDSIHKSWHVHSHLFTRFISFIRRANRTHNLNLWQIRFSCGVLFVSESEVFRRMIIMKLNKWWRWWWRRLKRRWWDIRCFNFNFFSICSNLNRI